MKQIKVLGSGCSKCTKTVDIISKIATELGVDAQIEKETNPKAIMDYGVMTTPAVVIDEELVHCGSIPSRDNIERWLTSA